MKREITGSWVKWGYWLNEIITHKAAWNPYIEKSTNTEALHALLQDILPVFGKATGKVIEVIEEIISAEQKLLIYGEVTGQKKPSEISKRNGIAYLEGWDTWSEIGEVSGKMQTQPAKVTFLTVKNPFTRSVYKEVAPLLQEMEDKFTMLTEKLRDLIPIVPEYTIPLIEELRDTMNMTALRAIQVNALYKFAASASLFAKRKLMSAVDISVDAINKAQEIVTQREQKYRVPVERIAGWRKKPNSL